MVRKSNLVLALLLALSLVLAACGGGGDDKADQPSETQPTAPVQAAGDAAKGKDLYATTCVACHGPNGEGVENLGKSFQTSDFLRSTSDDDMLAFLKKGRPPGDPANTTGVDMPPKGGNPALSDDDLRDIIAHLRTLQ